MRLVYSIAFYLGTPLIMLHFLLRGLRDARWLKRWDERFGMLPAGRQEGGIIVHAASVGEVNAATPLVGALLAERSEPITVTCFTPTGLQRVADTFGDRVHRCHAPLDLPGATARFFRNLKPRILIVVETEIWPNLYHHAGAAGTRILLVNASISARSASRYQKLGSLITGALGEVSTILAQGQADADRFVDCGANLEIVEVAGNLKLDVKVPEELYNEARQLRASWGLSRPVIVAGSTHASDESFILPVVAKLRREIPELLLVLAPRHPERFGEAYDSAARTGLKPVSFAVTNAIEASCACLVLDVMGELQKFYGCADIALVGGSFSDLGGHNIIEPAAMGVALMTGPDMSGSAEIMLELLSEQAVIQVADHQELESGLRQLLSDAEQRKTIGRAARRIVDSGKGALQRSLDSIAELMP